MAADVFVYLDVVQFSKNGVQNRNQVKTSKGASWLTIPVKQHLGQRLNEIEVADRRATTTHWKTLQANYARTPGFAKWKSEIEELLITEHTLLTDAVVASTEWMLDKLSTSTKRVKASELSNIAGENSKLVASICRELKADTYLTGTGALAYLDEGDFESIDIKVQTWKDFEYPQANSAAGFVPDLSTLDLLLNCPDTAAQMIIDAGGWESLPAK